jgi:hypothetical protein
MEKKEERMEEEFRKRFEKEKKRMRESFEKEFKKEFLKRKEIQLKAFISQKLPKEFLISLQGYFFEKLIRSLEAFTFELVPGKQQVDILFFYAFPVSKENKKKLKERLAKKLNILYYFEGGKQDEDKDKIKKILKEKLGIIGYFREGRKPELISGFALEINGFLFEVNLASEIEKIFYEKL